MAESLESLNESFCGAGWMELVEVIVAQFSVGCIGAKHLECNGKNFVTRSDDGFAPPAPRFHAAKVGLDVAPCTGQALSPIS
jgi:hypothetical protein